MSWIQGVPADRAGAALAPVYERIAAASGHGRVSNLWQTWGADAVGLGTLHAHYRALMASPAPLSPAQAEMVALVVSATNGCSYCVLTTRHSRAKCRSLGCGAGLARLKGQSPGSSLTWWPR